MAMETGMAERIEGTAPAESDAAHADEALSPDEESELLDKLRRWFNAGLEAEKENRGRAEKYERYKLGGKFQWGAAEEGSASPDEATNRPELTINLIPQFINQVVNEQRQNRRQIRVRPADSKADPATAEVINGLLRHIQQASMANWAYDWAIHQSVGGGWGHFWIEPVYVDDETNNQELRIAWVPSRFDVVWDRDSRLPWGGDAKHAFRTGMVSVEELEAMGGTAEEAAAESGAAWPSSWGDAGEWEEGAGERRKLRVCSAWWLEYKQITVRGRKRMTVEPELHWCKMTARKIIEGPRKLPGHKIPGVRVVGNMDILREGLRLYGLTELASGPQDAFNWAADDVFTRLSMKPLASVRAVDGQLGEFERDWIDAASGKPKGVLYHKGTMMEDEETPAPPPDLFPLPEVPAAHISLMQQSEHWVRATVGMYEPNLGQRQQGALSGVALRQQRTEGDSATFHYHDFMSYALHWAGTILVELLPSYYDWTETARILGEDGSESFVTLMAPGTLKDADGKPVARLERAHRERPEEKQVLYDLSVGQYDVVVDTGPAYATKREEAAEALGTLLPVMKEDWLLGADLFFRNLDVADADQLAQRYKALALSRYQFLEALEDVGTDGPTDKQKVVQLTATVAVLKEQLEALVPELQRLQAEVQDKSGERAVKVFEAQMKRYIAELEAQQKLMSDMVEAAGTVDVEKIRAAVKLGTERMKTIVGALGRGTGAAPEAPSLATAGARRYPGAVGSPMEEG